MSSSLQDIKRLNRTLTDITTEAKGPQVHPGKGDAENENQTKVQQTGAHQAVTFDQGLIDYEETKIKRIM